MKAKYNYRTGLQQKKHTVKRLLAGAGAAVMVTAAGSVPAMAAGNTQSGFTTGDCISDVFYGNEPNMANGAPGGPAEQQPGTQRGNVVPSQSPGPKKTVNGVVVPGNSIGDYQQMGINIPKLCHAAATQQ